MDSFRATVNVGYASDTGIKTGNISARIEGKGWINKILTPFSSFDGKELGRMVNGGNTNPIFQSSVMPIMSCGQENMMMNLMASASLAGAEANMKFIGHFAIGVDLRIANAIRERISSGPALLHHACYEFLIVIRGRDIRKALPACPRSHRR